MQSGGITIPINQPVQVTLPGVIPPPPQFNLAASMNPQLQQLAAQQAQQQAMMQAYVSITEALLEKLLPHLP